MRTPATWFHAALIILNHKLCLSNPPTPEVDLVTLHLGYMQNLREIAVTSSFVSRGHGFGNSRGTHSLVHVAFSCIGSSLFLFFFAFFLSHYTSMHRKFELACHAERRGALLIFDTSR